MRLKPLTKQGVGGWLAVVCLISSDRLHAQHEPVSRFDRVVAITSLAGNERKLSSGFFVEHNSRFFLITARHSALEMNLTTEVALPSVGSLRIYRLVDSIPNPGSNPWIMHDCADLAVCRVDLNKLAESLRDQIKAMSLGINLCQRELPLRSTRIEVIGFPMGLGVTQERISPLVTSCFVASEELSIAGTWGKEANFFGSPAVGSGASGGLVTLHAEQPTDCTVVGVFVGFNGDASGAKLSRILPAHILADCVDAQRDPTQAASAQEKKSQVD